MPVAGRKPKPPGQAINRNKPAFDWTEVPNVPFAEGRELPERRPDGKSWPGWTLDWWSAVSSMPHCSLWSDADWRFAMETALVVAEMHDGNVRLATEIRNREKVLGTTLDFRRDLRIKYVDPTKRPALAEVTNLADYADL